MKQPRKSTPRPTRKPIFPINLYCEGQQEQLYFKRLRDIINNDESATKTIVLESNNCEGGSPKKIAQKASGFTYSFTQPPFVTFDHDLKDEEFKDAIDICHINKMNMGYSNLNFDLWLALHKIRPASVSMAEKHQTNAYERDVIALFNLDKNAHIKSEYVINKIVEQIDFDDIVNAITCAERICKYNNDNATSKLQFTPKHNKYFINPDFSIHLI